MLQDAPGLPLPGERLNVKLYGTPTVPDGGVASAMSRADAGTTSTSAATTTAREARTVLPGMGSFLLECRTTLRPDPQWKGLVSSSAWPPARPIPDRERSRRP